MGLEAATYISQLDSANPLGSDARSQGDDHLRMIKQVLQNSFPHQIGATINGISAVTHDNSTAYTVDDSTPAAAAKSFFLSVGGALTAARELVLPTRVGRWLIYNNTGQLLTVKTAAGTGVFVPNGARHLVYCDGTNILSGVTSLPNNAGVVDSAGLLKTILHQGNLPSETGTFTPTVIGATTAGSASYATRDGYYSKIGKEIFVNIHLGWSGHSGTGPTRISDLPFAVGTPKHAAVALRVNSISGMTADRFLVGYASGGSSFIAIHQAPLGGGALSDISVPSSCSSLMISAEYKIT